MYYLIMYFAGLEPLDDKSVNDVFKKIRIYCEIIKGRNYVCLIFLKMSSSRVRSVGKR